MPGAAVQQGVHELTRPQVPPADTPRITATVLMQEVLEGVQEVAHPGSLCYIFINYS